MSVEVTCRKCGKQLRASDKYAGWRVECPQCKAMNQFPAVAEPLPETDEKASAPPAAPAGGTVQARPLPEPSGEAAQPQPVQEPSPEPTKEAAPSPAKASEVCSICEKDFSADPDRVQDPQGHLFHRACYEREQARRQAIKRCTLCDRLVSINDMVQDTEGKTYHRRCYDRERARRLAVTVRQRPTPIRPAPIKSPSPAAPSRPAEVKQPSPARPAPAPVPEEEIVDSSLLIPLPGPTENVVPANDLWGEVPGFGDQAADAYGSTLIYERPAKLSQGMYVLIGIGAAMPVLAILAMLIYSVTRSSAAPSAPAPSVAQSPPGASVPANVPNAVPAPAPSAPDWKAPTVERPTRTRDTDAEAKEKKARLQVLLFVLGVNFVLLVVYAILLRLGCTLCGEKAPSLLKAIAVTLVAFICSGVASFIVILVIGMGLATVVSPIVAFLIFVAVFVFVSGAIYTVTLPTSFDKAIPIAVVQVLAWAVILGCIWLGTWVLFRAS